jgi:hypothetical protein
VKAHHPAKARVLGDRVEGLRQCHTPLCRKGFRPQASGISKRNA